MLCLLLDENMPAAVKTQLLLQAPELIIYRIGEGSAPPAGTKDPDLLLWIESHGCLLVTNDRTTIPVHLAEHLAGGHHIPGIVQRPKLLNIPAVVADLLLVCTASFPNEWQDQILYLPLRR